MSIRVLCVDDNEWIGQALERRLRHDLEFEWLGWLPNTHDLVPACNERRPDIVLLDLDIPGDDAFIAIQVVRRESPDVRVLVLSGHVRSDYIGRAVTAGAWGYISKGEDNAFIIDAIKRVAGGQFVLGPDCANEWKGGSP